VEFNPHDDDVTRSSRGAYRQNHLKITVFSKEERIFYTIVYHTLLVKMVQLIFGISQLSEIGLKKKSDFSEKGSPLRLGF